MEISSNNLLDIDESKLTQIGRIGEHAIAYVIIDKNGKKFVLKKSNSTNILRQKQWKDSMDEVYSRYEDLFDKYTGNVKVGKRIATYKEYVVEEYLGKDFSKNVYNNLSNSKKCNLVKEYAGFLAYMHSIKTTNLPDKGTRLSTIIPEIDNKLIYKYFSNLLTEDDKKILSSIINQEIKEENEKVPIHGDLRDQNVLYDESTNRLGIIDFELLGLGNKYNDFIPAAGASIGMSYDFLFDVVDEYNKIVSENLKVNKELVKTYIELGILNEYGGVSIMSSSYLKENAKVLREKWKERDKIYTKEDTREFVNTIMENQTAKDTELDYVRNMMKQIKEVENSYNIHINKKLKKEIDTNEAERE